MMAAIVLERSNAYSNGADGSVDDTAENLRKNYGNGGNTFTLSPMKVGIIIAVIAATMAFGVMFWYYRKLDIRRRVDVRNRHRQAALDNGIHDSGLGLPGDPVELMDIFASEPRFPAARPGSAGEQKEIRKPPKAALLDYVHWKDPLKTEIIPPTPPKGKDNTGHATVPPPQL